MIKNKKRAAEKTADKTEPLEKKPFRDNKFKGNVKNKTENARNSKNFSKGKQSKFPAKPGFKKPFENKFKKNPGKSDGNAFKKPFENKFKKNPVNNAEAAAPEKTDWAKFKQDKKELKLKRKKSKDIYEISVEAKQIFEKLRCRRTEKKAELVEKLYNLFISGEDTFKKLVMAHDTARIIQCMLKFSPSALRGQISDQLLPLAVDMSISKYSHFCVLRMFKYGSAATKSKLVDSFFGNIIKLASHNISSKILDHVYLTVASQQQKNLMRQEFYGDLYKKHKDKNVKCLTDAYKDTPGMKNSILGAVKSNLEHIVNKQLVDNSLVHAVLLEYMNELDEDKIEETVSLFGPVIPMLLTTKDGCQASMICFYKSTAKNRRAIIKAIKEHLIKICTHEHGHVFILSVINSLDDTKATKKAIYDSIHPELKTLMSNQYGRRVIEWLINPGDTNSFHPAFIASLDEGLQYGKKDKEIRRKEIFEQIEQPIAAAICEEPQFWVSERHIGLVTAEILKRFDATVFVQAADALAQVIVKPDWTVTVEDETKEKKQKKPQDFEKIVAEATKLKKTKQKQKSKKEKIEEENEKDNEGENENDGNDNEELQKSESEEEEEEEKNTISVPGIEEAGFHIVLKKILKQDKARDTEETFGSLLLKHMTEETLDYWLTVNRACFVLLNILENNKEDLTTTLKKLIKPKLSLLKKQSSSGAKLLQKKLI